MLSEGKCPNISIIFAFSSLEYTIPGMHITFFLCIPAWSLVHEDNLRQTISRPAALHSHTFWAAPWGNHQKSQEPHYGI